MIGAQQGMDPFFGLHRADERYWEMFRKSSTTVKTEKIVLKPLQEGAPQVPAPQLRELRIADEVSV
jgi:hypothetical protein